MKARNHPIYRKLLQFDLDDPASELCFTERLARENGWEHDFAERVVVEYQRFLFLAVVTEHAVTPSDQVDQAWHLHLIYSHSYWTELCAEVLGRPLHHGPTRGGVDEHGKYFEWYDRTRRSYLDWFEEPPPIDIWPDSSVRFVEELHWRRVNTRRNWIIRKPALLCQLGNIPKWACLLSLLLCCLLAVTLLGVGPDLTDNSRPVDPSQSDQRVNSRQIGISLHAETSALSAELPWPLLIISLLIGLLLFSIRRANSCRICRSFATRQATGRTRSNEQGKTEEEYWCSRCLTTEWIEAPEPTEDGGCGCGGCGCGG